MQSLKVLNVAHNQFEEFPDTVIDCKLLEVIDVSHNKLRDFPGDLALRLPQLQSFVVDNNPV
jgi:Leucine-rich repeat (LRR) protein